VELGCVGGQMQAVIVLRMNKLENVPNTTTQRSHRLARILESEIQSNRNLKIWQIYLREKHLARSRIRFDIYHFGQQSCCNLPQVNCIPEFGPYPPTDTCRKRS
jgi:hypothetical protein